jgi:S1-C subfamily serine protease
MWRTILVASSLVAATIVEPAVATPTDDIARAEALIEVERFDRALGLLEKAEIADSLQMQRMDMALGRIFLGLGKPSRALEFFEKAANATADDAPALAGMAQCELALGQMAKARRHAEMALKTDPDLPAARLTLALVDERSGRREAAAQRLAALAQSMPDAEEVAVLRARFTATWDRPQAAQQLRDFVSSHPFAAHAEDALGRVMWDMGRHDLAVRHRRHAAELFAGLDNQARVEAINAWIAAVALPNQSAPPPVAVPPAGTPPPVTTPPTASPLPVLVPPPPHAPFPPSSGESLPPRHTFPPSSTEPPQQHPGFPPSSSEPPAPVGAPQAPVDVTPLPKRATAVPPQFPTALPFEPGTKLRTGSGIVLEGGRRVLTNRHVVSGMVKIAVRTGTGQLQMARVVAMADDDDLALLELPAPFPGETGFPLSRLAAPRAGRAIILMGYPLAGLLGDMVPSLTEGVVSKGTGLRDDPGTFQLSAKMNRGNSGGPIFDRRGNLIGVAVAKLDTTVTPKDVGAIEDVNLGIASDRIARFIKASMPAQTAPGTEMAAEDLYETMLPRVVLIAGQ